MSSEDLELNCGIRSVLTRHWIDLSKTNFFVRRGHVHMSGEVSLIGVQRPSEDTAVALRAVESDVRRLQAIKSLSFDFTNWVRDDSGVWKCSRKKSEEPRRGNADEVRESSDEY
ncbi:MAG TPA: hypothetical protein VK843_01175 [Planctomycetota bacterium]|nr:hypothetical protein [Planctomycetota bacterium]